MERRVDEVRPRRIGRLFPPYDATRPDQSKSTTYGTYLYQPALARKMSDNRPASAAPLVPCPGLAQAPTSLLGNRRKAVGAGFLPFRASDLSDAEVGKDGR